MPRFDYARAVSIDEAVALLSDPHCVSRPLAGGTDLLVQTRHGPPAFQRLVDVSRVPEMRTIERRGDEIHIGAAVTYTEIIDSELLRETATCLVEAAQLVGGPAIANAGTLGGNVANAAACADGIPPLVCLDAVAHLVSREGRRDLLVSEVVTGPHQNALKPGELITHFTFPALPVGARSVFLKLGRRNAQAIARLNVAAAGRVSPEGRIDFARLTPGSATPRAVRLTQIETMLIGCTPSRELFEEAGAEAARAMIAVTGRRWSTEYKEIALHGLVARALRHVFNLELER